MSINSTHQNAKEKIEQRFPHRVTAANDKPVFETGDYVLVVLHRALRGIDNLVIDAARLYAGAIALEVVVCCELDTTMAYASDRLCYFALGAFREVATALQSQNITCLQFVRTSDSPDHLATLVQRAAVVYTDEDHTHWDQQRLARLLDVAHQSVLTVDASRLVPIRCLPKGLKTTPDFRKAHGALREEYATRAPVDYPASKLAKTKVSGNFANCDDEALKQLVAQYAINHDIAVSTEHPPTQAEITARLTRLQTHILAKYKWIRNNASLEYSTSLLSPYLHFGMLSPHQVWAAIDAADVPKSYTWKFRDELLTWREWSHYQAFYDPLLHTYESLPAKARNTLDAHANDARPELAKPKDIMQGNTADATWNASQREWVNTGWLHNNLRMYWSKQILRFTPAPKVAWELACRINDYVSLDGRDPATYASMRWGFGDAKPGYSEKDIYGWVAPKSDRAILKRKGMAEWIAARNPAKE